MPTGLLAILLAEYIMLKKNIIPACVKDGKKDFIKGTLSGRVALERDWAPLGIQQRQVGIDT